MDKFSQNCIKKRFYEKKWFAVLMLVLFYPVGIFLMWRYNHFNVIIKVIITVIFFIFTIGMFGKNEDIIKNSDAKLQDNENIESLDNQNKNIETIKSIGHTMSSIKDVYDARELGFNFEERKLSNNRDALTGQSPIGKGTAIVEVTGDLSKDIASSLTIIIANSSDNNEHNLYNLLYLATAVQEFTSMGDSTSDYITNSLTKIVSDPDIVSIEYIDGNILKMQLMESLGSVMLVIYPE